MKKETKKKTKPLIDKHKLFCHAYLANGCNGTAAYKEVYKDVTDDTAKNSAARLIANDYIRQYIDTLLLNKFGDMSGIATAVIERLMGIVGTNMTELISWNHSAQELVDSHKLTRKQAASVKKISQKVTKNDEWGMSIEQHSPIKAAELLMKYVGMLQDKVDLTSGGMPVQPVFNYIMPKEKE